MIFTSTNKPPRTRHPPFKLSARRKLLQSYSGDDLALNLSAPLFLFFIIFFKGGICWGERLFICSSQFLFEKILPLPARFLAAVKWDFLSRLLKLFYLFFLSLLRSEVIRNGLNVLRKEKKKQKTPKPHSIYSLVAVEE